MLLPQFQCKKVLETEAKARLCFTLGILRHGNSGFSDALERPLVSLCVVKWSTRDEVIPLLSLDRFSNRCDTRRCTFKRQLDANVSRPVTSSRTRYCPTTLLCIIVSSLFPKLYAVRCQQPPICCCVSHYEPHANDTGEERRSFDERRRDVDSKFSLLMDTADGYPDDV
jgi:hypothetical protein